MSKTRSARKYLLISIYAFLCLAGSIVQAQGHVTYVPISTGDILFFIPIFDEDGDNNGVPDHSDPGVGPTTMVEAFFAALEANDIDVAMKFLLTKKSERYRAAFSSLGPIAGQVVSQITNITTIHSSEHLVEVAVNRNVDGAQRVFFITLMRDRNGTWKIVQI